MKVERCSNHVPYVGMATFAGDLSKAGVILESQRQDLESPRISSPVDLADVVKSHRVVIHPPSTPASPLPSRQGARTGRDRDVPLLDLLQILRDLDACELAEVDRT